MQNFMQNLKIDVVKSAKLMFVLKRGLFCKTKNQPFFSKKKPFLSTKIKFSDLTTSIFRFYMKFCIRMAHPCKINKKSERIYVMAWTNYQPRITLNLRFT